MGLSIWQILIVVVLIVLLFGRGKISELMGDLAKGIKSFKKGLSEEDTEKQEPPKNITHEKSGVASEHEGEKNKTS
ncbi:MAG: twin-arginine translocase TatA/TatE family subunit [Alphaproteobacteria bacterium]|nr:MAG: twin-arginine translocase TatA/TatE family subunit [Alphaproteobacteria bacterium]